MDQDRLKTQEHDRQIFSKSAFSKLALVFAAVLAIVVAVILLNQSRVVGVVEGVELHSMKTYLSKSNDDPDRKLQSSFKKGDPIQIGFTYEKQESLAETAEVDPEGEDEPVVAADPLVRFVIQSPGEENIAFETGFFRLDTSLSELFVSINNTNLNENKYSVQMRDIGENIITSTDYKIVE